MNIKNALLLVGILAMGGCVIAVDTDDWNDHDDWYERQEDNSDNLDDLALGTSEIDVRSEFGKPDFTESFVRGEDSFLVLYYRTRHVKGDGLTTKDETTPLVFVDGELVGWGDSAVKYAVVNDS